MSWRNESGGRWSDGDLEPIDGLRSDSNEWERSSTQPYKLEVFDHLVCN